MIPLYALGLSICILFGGLAVDSARMELLKTQMQNASDSAAIAAELESEQVSNNIGGPYDWVAQGKADAALNGFTDGVNGTTITVAVNPTSGTYMGRYDVIQVTITHTFNSMFMGMLNHGTYTLTTTGAAQVPPCAYFLAGQSSMLTNTNAFWVASGTFAAYCPIYANYGAWPDGFSKLWGFGLLVSTNNGNNGGGWTSQYMEEGWGGIPPQQAPTYGVPVMTDPLLSYIPTEPTFNGSCYKTNYSISGTTSVTLNPPPSGQAYCGTYNTSTKTCTPGLTITTTGTVTLNPGLYVFTCGVAWNNATVTGTGVTLYFTNPTQGSGVGFGQVLFGRAGLGGACALSLSAPTVSANGSIAAILMFLDRNWVTASTANDWDIILDTYTTFSGDGIWYAPHTGFYAWLGSYTFPNYGTLVVNDGYLFGGQIEPNANFAWLSGGNPFRTQEVLVQ
jgi:hypothetical protein